jgi:hypothetical protein
MASTIAAITTGVGGVVTTADASGDLSLLSGATTVVAVTSTGVAVTGTLSSSGASTLTGAITATAGINTPNTFGFKNRIINGGMVIDQRNAGAAVTPTNGQYTLDRWCANMFANTGKFTVQQNAGAVTPPVGFTKYLGVTSTSAYSIGVGDIYTVFQIIEGFNIADLAWGTANAKTVTLSFQVYSSLTGTFGGALCNAGTRSYPFTYSIPVANTWTTISATIAGDTSGTWATDNTSGLQIRLGLGVGSTYSTTANSWAAGNYFSATGAVSVVGTNGATFYITGVQLEKGSTATSFDFRAFPTEFAMCQRYYETSFDYGTAPQNGGASAFATNYGLWGGYSSNTVPYFAFVAFKVSKRTQPSFTSYGNSSGYWWAAGGFNVNAAQMGGIGFNGLTVAQQVVVGASLTAGHWAVTSEL